LKSTKPIKRIGKVGLEWQRTRRAWYKANPPDYRGYWECYICGMPTDTPDLDHLKGKGANPDKRADLTNLKPAHRDCHRRKTDRV